MPVFSGANEPGPKLTYKDNLGGLNIASYNFRGVAGYETIKVHRIKILQKYDICSCGSMVLVSVCSQWAYFVDVDMDLECDIAVSLDKEASILYSW